MILIFPFLENYVKRDSQSITNQEFNFDHNNCTNVNDMFLMLVKDDVVTDNVHTNTLRLPNKEQKICNYILVIKYFKQVLKVI